MLPFGYGETCWPDQCKKGLYYTPASGCTLMHFRCNGDGTFTMGRLQKDGSFREGGTPFDAEMMRRLGQFREVHLKTDAEIKRYQEAERVLSDLPNTFTNMKNGEVAAWGYDENNNLVRESKQTIYKNIMESVSKQVKKALLEYNGDDAIDDAEKSGYEPDSVQYKSILRNGPASKFYGKDPAQRYSPDAAEIGTLGVDLNFRKCFMMYDEGTDSVLVFGYEDIEDLCYLYGIDLEDEFYTKLDYMKVGESMINPETNGIYTRIK